MMQATRLTAAPSSPGTYSKLLKTAMRTSIKVPIPIAPPIDSEAPRQFCSVMIPAYEPEARHLEAALRSVLDQGEGPDRMQIAVVDDGSPTVDVAGFVRKFCGDRVDYHRNPSNLRLAGNWNRAIELARGQWIHLLHQDDLVRPGFYEAINRTSQAAPETGMFCCQNAFINDEGRWTSISELIRPEPGLIEGWLGTICERQLLQCPAVAVRRDTYERVGGFRTDLLYVLDWEMWVRIAAAGIPCWYEPEVLAMYRHHGSAETDRLQESNLDLVDARRGMEIVRGYLPAEFRRKAGRGIREVVGMRFLRQAATSLADGHAAKGLADAHRACWLHPPIAAQSTLFSFYKWAVKTALIGSQYPERKHLPPGGSP